MFELRTLLPTDPGWLQSLCDVRHDLYHLPAYIQAEDAFRGDQSQLFVVRDSNAALLVPLTLRELPGDGEGLDATSPYGYPGPLATPGATAEWLDGAIQWLFDNLREMGVVSLFLRFHPLLGVPAMVFQSQGTIVEQGQTVAVPLRRPFEDIRAAMRKGNRYDIRKALQRGQVAKQDSEWAHFEAFLAIYEETMVRVGATSQYFFSRQYFERLRDDLSSNVTLWTTQIGGEVAAASLITECDGIVQYHLSGTSEAFIHEYPTKVLLDRAIAWANERGNRTFHLGGGLGGQEDSLFRFKSGFSKQQQPFFTARIIINERRYKALIEEWEEASGQPAQSVTGFFPQYRRPIRI